LLLRPIPARPEDFALRFESARALTAYGWPSAINRLLILNAELQSCAPPVGLQCEATGF